ncbi:MAG TPA: TIGR04182 family glycosyltransferase, partial [Methanocorpusculum sp.]|nr:TIGR04182 family glycosyltransferase [Methanocorpusculum sp.]
NLRFEVVPTYYRKRTGAPTKLRPFSDGMKIILAINKYGRMNNPLFYFIFIGLILLLVGIGIGIYVIVEWLHAVEHLPLTVLTVLLVITGILTIMLGFISNMMVAYHREEMLAIERISREMRKNE